MNKFYYAIIGVLLVGIGLVFALPSRKHHENTTTVGVQNTLVNVSGDDTMTNTDSNSRAINPLTYTNTEYGFQLTLPKGWEGYKVFIYTGSSIDSKIGIVFALPTDEKGWPGVIDPQDNNRFISGYTGQYQYITGYADMIGISILTHEQYNMFINTPDVMYTKESLENSVRGHTEKFVYIVVGGPNDRPTDIYKKRKERDAEGRGNYFQQIQNSFKTL